MNKFHLLSNVVLLLINEPSSSKHSTLLSHDPIVRRDSVSGHLGSKRHHHGSFPSRHPAQPKVCLS